MCSGEISIGSGEICPLHSSIGSSPWPSWFGRHPNPALGHFHALLFSYSLVLASQPPLYTAALGATHKSSIWPAAGHSGGCPSSAPVQFVMRACSHFWPLLGSTSTVETQARDCSSDLSDPCSTSSLPSWVLWWQMKRRHPVYFLQSFQVLAVMPTVTLSLLLAAFAIRFLAACSSL